MTKVKSKKNFTRNNSIIKKTTIKNKDLKRKDEKAIFNTIAFNTTVVDIIRENEFTRIKQIQEQLATRGIVISEFKLRRHLKEVNITKSFNKEGRKVYQTHWSSTTPTFNTQIKDLITSIRSNNILLVLKTVSGAAPFVAKVIDNLSEELRIMGTIAGDDSVVIIPLDTSELDTIYERISNKIKPD